MGCAWSRDRQCHSVACPPTRVKTAHPLMTCPTPILVTNGFPRSRLLSNCEDKRAGRVRHGDKLVVLVIRCLPCFRQGLGKWSRRRRRKCGGVAERTSGEKDGISTAVNQRGSGRLLQRQPHGFRRSAVIRGIVRQRLSVPFPHPKERGPEPVLGRTIWTVSPALGKFLPSPSEIR